MGSKSKKKAKTRLDAYYRLAKDQGYRARSAFKLIQLNRKYDFLAKSRVLVDLCAAPGGWCQVAAKYMPVGSKIVGVDLVPIAPIRGCKTFVGDITDDKTRKMINTWLKKEPVDTVIHDGAPNVGGVWSRDLFEQNALVLAAAKMACSMLKLDGWFVTKVFRSQDFQKLLWVLKQLFEKVEATKPLASRMESAEIFVVCAGFKAPKKLDPAMFNAQKVFSDVGEEKLVTPSGALAAPRSKVPEGYTEFATITHDVAPFSEFVKSSDPKGFLRSHHELRFASDEDKVYLTSKHSRKELVHLCGDLRQVGDADLRRLLRWREQLLREQQRLLREDDADPEAAAGDEGEEEEEEGIDLESAEGVRKVALELLAVRKRKAKEQKKKVKKVVDRKLKLIKGLINYDPNTSAEHMTEPEGFDGEGGDEEFGDDDDEDAAFTVEKLRRVDEAELADLMDKHWEEPDAADNAPLNPVTTVNLNTQDDWDLGQDAASPQDLLEGERSLQLVEGEEHTVDVDNYGNYIPAKRSARVKIFEEGLMDDQEGEGEEEEEAALSPAEQKKKARREKDDADIERAGKQSKWLQHHVNIEKVLSDTFPTVKTPRASATKKRTKKNGVLDEDRVEMQASAPLHIADSASRRAATRFDRHASDDDDDSLSSFSDPGVEEKLDDLEIHQGRVDSRRKKALVPDLGKLTAQELVRQQRKQALEQNKEIRKKEKRTGKKKGDDTEFEEIPIALTDPNVRARTLAIATKMLTNTGRREILDASVNKYTFNDDDDLPDWFVKDEQRNCKVMLPLTAEEVEAQRARFQEMNARPGKKVMEAMGRKRRRAQRMLHGLLEKGKSDPRAREKANGLSVRRLMRSQVMKGNSNKKKNKPLDKMAIGQKRREKQRVKKQSKKRK